MGVQYDVHFSNCTKDPTWHNCSRNWHIASSTFLSASSYKKLTETTVHVGRNKNFHTWLHNKIKGPVFQDKTHGQVNTQSDSHLSSPHMQTKNYNQWHNIQQHPMGKDEPTPPHQAYGSISLHSSTNCYSHNHKNYLHHQHLEWFHSRPEGLFPNLQIWSVCCKI